MSIKTLLTTAAIAVALPALASAASFDFSGPKEKYNQGALTFTDAGTGVSASIFAGTHLGANAPFFFAKDCGKCVSQSSDGLGVDRILDLSSQIEAFEYLTIKFSESVALDKVWLNSAGLGDEWDMAVDNHDISIGNIFGTDNIRGGWLHGGLPKDDLVATASTDYLADFAANGGSLFGKEFTFYTDGLFDDYKVGAMDFTKVGAVPLPAGAVLLLTGFGAFGAMRARKKAA